MKKYEKEKINKFYAYKEYRKNEKVIEFGWVPVKYLPTGKDYVIAKSEDNPGYNNASTLEDYREFFTKLTKDSPELFLQKWGGKENELSDYWYKTIPKSEPNTHKFMISLAKLILNKESFEHKFIKFSTYYEVVEAENEKSKSENRDKN